METLVEAQNGVPELKDACLWLSASSELPKMEEMAAGIEPNEHQLNDGRSPTSKRGETPEREQTRKDSSDVSLTDRPRRYRRPLVTCKTSESTKRG